MIAHKAYAEVHHNLALDANGAPTASYAPHRVHLPTHPTTRRRDQQSSAISDMRYRDRAVRESQRDLVR